MQPYYKVTLESFLRMLTLQLSSTSNSFPSTSGQLKRFTLQVSRLDYESAGADPELYSDYYNDGYTYSTRLLDLNSNDLYTKYRSAGQWEGNASPDIDQDYGNTAYFNEDTAIHSVKGTPARFRKIPLCTPDGTGYFLRFSDRSLYSHWF